MMRIRRIKPLLAAVAAAGTVGAFATPAAAVPLPIQASTDCAVDVRVWKVIITLTNVDTSPATVVSLKTTPAYPLVGIPATIPAGSSVTGTISGLPDLEATVTIDWDVRFADGTSSIGSLSLDRPTACNPPPPPPPPPTTTTTAAPTTTTTTLAPTTTSSSTLPPPPTTTVATTTTSTVATTTTTAIPPAPTTSTATSTTVATTTTSSSPSTPSSSSVPPSSSSSSSSSSSVPPSTVPGPHASSTSSAPANEHASYRRRARRHRDEYGSARDRQADASGEADEASSDDGEELLAQLRAEGARGADDVSTMAELQFSAPIGSGPAGTVVLGLVVLGEGALRARRRRTS